MKYEARPKAIDDQEATLRALGSDAAQPPSRMSGAPLELSADPPSWTELLPSSDIGWREGAAVYGLRFSGVITLDDGQEIDGFFNAFVVHSEGAESAVQLFQHRSEFYSPPDVDVDGIVYEDVDDFVDPDSPRPRWRDRETATWPRIGDEAGEFLFELVLPKSRRPGPRFLQACTAYFFGFDRGGADPHLVAVVQDHR